MIIPVCRIAATERIDARLRLNFAIGSLDPRITFTRALDTATEIGPNGYIVSAFADTPRFAYNPITLACKGLLIESPRTNLLLQSQAFQTTWTTTSCTVDDDAVDGPDGMLTADKIIPNTGASVSYSAASVLVRQDITKTAAATTYTYSIFAKAAEFNGIRLFVRDNASSANNAVASFSLVNGAIAVAASAAGTFTNASAIPGELHANGFYRFGLTFTTGTETVVRILAIPANSTATTGDGVKGIYVFGGQLEVGASLTSYIPTTTTAVVRNADVATMTGTNFSDWFNPSAGTFYINTDARSGETLLTAGSFTLSSDTTGLKKYASSFSADPGASQLSIGPGTIREIEFYRQALSPSALQMLKTSAGNRSLMRAVFRPSIF